MNRSLVSNFTFVSSLFDRLSCFLDRVTPFQIETFTTIMPTANMNVNDANRQDDHSLRNQRQQEKKCHGNRRDQRFRRKCRAQGMKPSKIEQLVQQRKQSDAVAPSVHHDRRNTNMSHQHINEAPMMSHQMRTTMATSNQQKRKRDQSSQEQPTATASTVPKSASSISLRQSALKKKKKKKKAELSTIRLRNVTRHITNKNYRWAFTSCTMLNG